jgi:FkbH-like protein
LNEDRLREILAEWLQISPDQITDETKVGDPPAFDSLAIMQLVLAVEVETGKQFNDDQIAVLTNWRDIKRVMLDFVQPTFYKALVLDADGTLWDGIAAEGGALVTDPFLEAQAIYRELRKRGVILAVATKNEPGEVEAVLRAPEGFLDPEDFTIIQAGWGNKVFSLKAIAKELNIGLDAIVFVDDSPFECEYVRTQLPEVKVVQVPKDLTDYPRVAQEIAELFPKMIDTSKTEQYRALAEAEKTRPHFATEREYLASLGIEVEIHVNRTEEIARISELTQKANQFNLTTRRYTEAQIKDFMLDDYVYSIHYRDRFGDQGLTGVCIITNGLIDTFLLSCRILGRGVELAAIWRISLEYSGETIGAMYIPTAKNEQVRDFWGAVGLRCQGTRTGIVGDGIYYLGEMTATPPDYIQVILD